MINEQDRVVRRDTIGLSIYTITTILFLYLGITTLLGLLPSMSFPFELDREEGYLLFQATTISEGNSIYEPITEEPYLVGNYSPIYLMLWAIPTKIFGPSLFAGRLIVFLSLLGIVGLLSVISWRQHRHVFAAITTPCLFLSCWGISNWARFGRVDLPGLFFCLLAIFFVLQSTRMWGVIAAAISCFLAVYTKQSLIFAPTAILLYFLMTRRWKEAGWFLGVSAGLGVIALLIGQLLTSGEFFRHMVTYNKNVMYWDSLKTWFLHLGRHHYLLYLSMIPCTILFVLRMKKERSDKVPLLLGVYMLLAFLSILTVAKAGSAVNYLLEWKMAGALFVGIALGQHHGHKALVYTAWILVLLHGINHARMPHLRNPISNPLYEQLEAATQDLQFRLIASEGAILSEDPSLLIPTHQKPVYEPFIMTQLSKEGIWDQSPFVERLANRRFSMIITVNDLEKDALLPGWTDEMRDAILANYQLTQRYPSGLPRASYHLYTQKPDTPEETE